MKLPNVIYLVDDLDGSIGNLFRALADLTWLSGDLSATGLIEDDQKILQVEVEALPKAVRALASRHDILRPLITPLWIAAPEQVSASGHWKPIDAEDAYKKLARSDVRMLVFLDAHYFEKGEHRGNSFFLQQKKASEPLHVVGGRVLTEAIGTSVRSKKRFVTTTASEDRTMVGHRLRGGKTPWNVRYEADAYHAVVDGLRAWYELDTGKEVQLHPPYTVQWRRAVGETPAMVVIRDSYARQVVIDASDGHLEGLRAVRFMVALCALDEDEVLTHELALMAMGDTQEAKSGHRTSKRRAPADVAQRRVAGIARRLSGKNGLGVVHKALFARVANSGWKLNRGDHAVRDVKEITQRS